MTNSEELAKCMEIFRAHGVTKETDQMNKRRRTLVL